MKQLKGGKAEHTSSMILFMANCSTKFSSSSFYQVCGLSMKEEKFIVVEESFSEKSPTCWGR